MSCPMCCGIFSPRLNSVTSPLFFAASSDLRLPPRCLGRRVSFPPPGCPCSSARRHRVVSDLLLCQEEALWWLVPPPANRRQRPPSSDVPPLREHARCRGLCIQVTPEWSNPISHQLSGAFGSMMKPHERKYCWMGRRIALGQRLRLEQMLHWQPFKRN